MTDNNIQISGANLVVGVLGNQSDNLLGVLSAKNILKLAETIPNGKELIDEFVTLRETGSKRIPENQRGAYAEMAICSIILARHSFSMITKLIADMDPDDISQLGSKKERLFSIFMNSYGKSVDSLLKSMRALGYEGHVEYPASLGAVMAELVNAEKDNKALEITHEEKFQ